MVFNAVLTALDYALLGLHWVKLSAETVVIVGCDGEPLAVDRIDYLLDNAWEKIAEACAGITYAEDTIRDWIKDLCPDRSAGRRRGT